MIKYSLFCENEHDFEAWFSNSAEYASQDKRALVSCPYCGSTKINKALMTPSIPNRQSKNLKQFDNEPQITPDQTLTTADKMPEKFSQVLNQMREMRTHIQKNSEDVGKNFAEEARKIHYGETKKRGIYGQASQKEVEGLVEEGVEVLPIPALPEDQN